MSRRYVRNFAVEKMVNMYTKTLKCVTPPETFYLVQKKNQKNYVSQRIRSYTQKTNMGFSPGGHISHEQHLPNFNEKYIYFISLKALFVNWLAAAASFRSEVFNFSTGYFMHVLFLHAVVKWVSLFHWFRAL